MSEAAIHFSDVTFGFGNERPLFENLSCSFTNDSGSGKVIALMGPSGVGKSTFCDLALGTRQPQIGSVSLTPTHANIAVIPQKAVIFDELSVMDNIACLKHSISLGKTFREDKVKHAVESLGLSSVIQNGTRASALSGGESQRVMLARIQTVGCDLLILDEPCSFLDNRVKDSFLAALRATVDELGLLALMVTHVWDEARLIADEVVFFHHIHDNPVTLYRSTVSQAVASPPTIDALFGIHWPDCLVLEATDYLGGLSSKEIPKDSCSIGVFRNANGMASANEWARELWNGSKKPYRDNRFPFSKREHESAFSLSAVFYDKYGIRVSDRTKTI